MVLLIGNRELVCPCRHELFCKCLANCFLGKLELVSGMGIPESSFEEKKRKITTVKMNDELTTESRIHNK